jgi:hypothetical protein
MDFTPAIITSNFQKNVLTDVPLSMLNPGLKPMVILARLAIARLVGIGKFKGQNEGLLSVLQKGSYPCNWQGYLSTPP